MPKKNDRQAPARTGAPSPAEINEAAYFARKCGLTREEALRIMREAHASLAVKATDIGKRKH